MTGQFRMGFMPRPQLDWFHQTDLQGRVRFFFILSSLIILNLHISISGGLFPSFPYSSYLTQFPTPPPPLVNAATAAALGPYAPFLNHPFAAAATFWQNFLTARNNLNFFQQHQQQQQRQQQQQQERSQQPTPNALQTVITPTAGVSPLTPNSGKSSGSPNSSPDVINVGNESGRASSNRFHPYRVTSPIKE